MKNVFDHLFGQPAEVPWLHATGPQTPADLIEQRLVILDFAKRTPTRRETGLKGGSWDENGNFHRSPQTQALLEDYYRNFSVTVTLADEDEP